MRLEILARGLVKSFGATQALASVDFDVHSGEVHALVGENGAGKSTLIKILSGVYRADAGTIQVAGSRYAPTTPAEARQAGIALIPQELRVVPSMTVAENVLLGSLPTKRFGGPLAAISEPRMRARAGELLARLGVGIDPKKAIGDLGFAERQLVVIARALNFDANCLILDEPTASLESREVDRLFEILDHLKAAGKALIYVSHRLEEIERIADRTTVLRDGRSVAEYGRGDFAVDDLIRDMTGRSLEVLKRPHLANRGSTRLQSSIPTVGGAVQSVTLTERVVTGLAGLLGSGATHTMLAIYGARGTQANRIGGDTVTVRGPRDAVDHGIGFVPSERSLGIVPTLSVADNIVLPHLHHLRAERGLSWAAIRDLTAELIQRLDIRPGDPTVKTSDLSGGNQQKVLFARWLVGHMSILLLDEPTHGIDIGAKARIDLLIREFAENGGAVMMASSEIHELLLIADEVVTVRQGRITARIERGDPAYSEKTVRTALGG